MKTIHLFLALAMPLIGVACNGSSHETTSATPTAAQLSSTSDNGTDECLTVFSHINREDVIHYKNKDPEMDIEGLDGFYARAACNLAWPKTVMGRSSKKLEQALIDELTGDPGKFNTLDAALKNLIDATQNIPFEKNEIKDVKHIKKIPEDAGMNQAYFDVQLTMKTLDKNLCVFMFAKDNYMGGAHGLYWTQYVNYDVAQDKVIKLTDLVTDTVKLRKAITEALFEQEGVTSITALNENGFLLEEGSTTVPITQNIYMENFSIHFVYSPYEIACYARGEVDVCVEPYRLDALGIQSKYLSELIDRYTR